MGAALCGALLVLVGCQSAVAPRSFREPAAYERSIEVDLEMRELDLLRAELSSTEPSERAAWLALDERARRFAEQVPDWVAPERLVDDLERASLRGPWVWERRWRAHEERTTASGAYLLGRLESAQRAKDLFQEASNLDPNLAWGMHGLAWSESGANEFFMAHLYGQLAARKVDSRHEALVVGRVYAASLEGNGNHEAARAFLRELAAMPGLLPAESASLAATELISQLLHPSITTVIRGKLGSTEPNEVIQKRKGGTEEARKLFLAALELLGSKSALPDAELPALVRAVREADLGRDARDVLSALTTALAGRTGRRAASMRTAVWRELETNTMGRLLAPGPSGLAFLDAEERSAALALERGDFGSWLATWRARLPERLRRPVVEAGVARGVPFAGSGLLRLATDPSLIEPGPLGASQATRAARALMEAGWFEAARVVLVHSGVLGDPELEELVAQNEARSVLLAELTTLAAEATTPGNGGPKGLDAFLERVAELVEHWGSAAFGAHDPVPGMPLVGRLDGDSVRSSSQENYGPLASLVQPGPRAAAHADAKPLDGFAALQARLGRMAVVGSQAGRLDVTQRSVIATEYVAGTHLGAPYSGTAFWCQGVDVASRAERAGAGIAGAAVHDGYWVDIEGIRRESQHWLDLEEGYAWLLAEGAAEPMLFPAPPACSVAERDRRVPLLGEGRRLSLQLIREGRLPTFEDLLQLVAIHEEGHLCDRARFLPLADHWPAALGFLASVQFSPDRLMRRLEYRAELVSLCELPDPRPVLVEILNMVEDAEAGPEKGLTPHGAAYVDLLNDLVDLADERLEAGATPLGLAPERYLRWQWHRIDPEELRSLALELARREGLVESATN